MHGFVNIERFIKGTNLSLYYIHQTKDWKKYI